MYIEPEQQKTYEMVSERPANPKANGRRLVVLGCISFWVMVIIYALL